MTSPILFRGVSRNTQAPMPIIRPAVLRIYRRRRMLGRVPSPQQHFAGNFAPDDALFGFNRVGFDSGWWAEQDWMGMP